MIERPGYWVRAYNATTDKPKWVEKGDLKERNERPEKIVALSPALEGAIADFMSRMAAAAASLGFTEPFALSVDYGYGVAGAKAEIDRLLSSGGFNSHSFCHRDGKIVHRLTKVSAA